MNKILQKRIEEVVEKIVCSVQCAYFALDKTCNCYAKKFCIKTAEEILQNQWISVEEALPDDDENVFIMNEYGGYGYAHYDYNNKIWRMSSGCNADESDEIYSAITHWMEIPKNK